MGKCLLLFNWLLIVNWIRLEIGLISPIGETEREAIQINVTEEYPPNLIYFQLPFQFLVRKHHNPHVHEGFSDEEHVLSTRKRILTHGRNRGNEISQTAHGSASYSFGITGFAISHEIVQMFAMRNIFYVEAATNCWTTEWWTLRLRESGVGILGVKRRSRYFADGKADYVVRMSNVLSANACRKRCRYWCWCTCYEGLGRMSRY